MNENIIKLAFENDYGTKIIQVGRYDTETAAMAIKEMLQTYSEYNQKNYKEVVKTVTKYLNEIKKGESQ